MGTERRLFKIGRIDYVNTLPIYFDLDLKGLSEEVEMVAATPARLNRMLSGGELNLSAISAAEYALHFRQYRLIPGLSIACAGAVGSVLWYAKRPFSELDDAPFLLTDASLTSAWLSQILFARAVGVRPRFFTGSVDECALKAPDLGGFLCIGDQALLAEKVKGHFPHRLDLGEAWHRLTGRPFVFGVWAVRQDALSEYPQLCREAMRALRESRRRGLFHLDHIASETARKLAIPAQECRRYLENIHYELAPPFISGMELFFAYLHDSGLIPDPVELDFAEFEE